jgi:hypothetical protein
MSPDLGFPNGGALFSRWALLTDNRVQVRELLLQFVRHYELSGRTQETVHGDVGSLLLDRS